MVCVPLLPLTMVGTLELAENRVVLTGLSNAVVAIGGVGKGTTNAISGGSGSGI